MISQVTRWISNWNDSKSLLVTALSHMELLQWFLIRVDPRYLLQLITLLKKVNVVMALQVLVLKIYQLDWIHLYLMNRHSHSNPLPKQLMDISQTTRSPPQLHPHQSNFSPTIINSEKVSCFKFYYNATNQRDINFEIIPSLFIFNKYFHLCLIDWNEISTSKPKNTSMLKTRSENTNRTSTSILKQQLGLLPSPSNNNSNVGSSISQLHLSGPQTGNFNINKPINSFWTLLNTWKCGNNYYYELFLIISSHELMTYDRILLL